MMKKLLLLLLMSFSFLNAQIYDVETLKYSGDVDNRINLVILSEGYQDTEFTQFMSDATNFVNDMFSQTPFAEYEDYFNVYAIKVPSNESGASHPGTATDEGTVTPAVPITSVDNFFGTSFDSFNIHRLLYTFNASSIATVLANNFPQYDQALLLINSPYYGGSGGMFPMASTETTSSEIAIHELGHSFANLKDEYYPGDAQVGEAINMTQNNNPTTVKWKNWYGDNGVGIYAYGASGMAATWFRPHQNCKMRYLGVDFCSVCVEGIIEKIHTLVSPIDSYTPVSSTVENPSFPATFELNLIQPITPFNLQTVWTLNSTEFATNISSLDLQDSNLNNGSNTLSVVVTDNTPLLRVDNHEIIHANTITWTIDYTLGIENISSSTNKINISFYPNPVEDILTIKTENDLGKMINAQLVSMEGKLIKEFHLSNMESQEVSLIDINQGIYLLNFYEGNILIGSKKIVKN